MEAQNEKKYACPFTGCTSVFNRPYRLAQHRLIHYDLKPFACTQPNCTKAYTSKSHLDRHIKTAHSQSELDILYCCPVCMKKYANRQNLKRHLKINHIDNNKKPFSCDVCKLQFKRKTQVEAHMFQHHGIKAFSCALCDKDFITSYERRKHMRNHKTHICEHCDQQFTRWTDLMSHKRMDHKTAEYICHDCGKKFKGRSHIIRHVKKHMPSTPVTIFFCPFENCFRHYSRKSNLKQHILSKHEGESFTCTLCGAHLSTKAKLNEHIERHSQPEAIISTPKTLETGRKRRKDLNSMKYDSALRLAGMTIEDIQARFPAPEVILSTPHDSEILNSFMNSQIASRAFNSVNIVPIEFENINNLQNTPNTLYNTNAMEKASNATEDAKTIENATLEDAKITENTPKTLEKTKASVNALYILEDTKVADNDSYAIENTSSKENTPNENKNSIENNSNDPLQIETTTTCIEIKIEQILDDDRVNQLV